MYIDRQLYNRKQAILSYYRDRADESLSEITDTFGTQQFRKRAHAINEAVARTRERLLATIRQVADEEGWSRNELLPNLLMQFYCSYVVMLERRNSVWPYEYMTFSRRIGEMWEPFCAICFEYPPRTDGRLFTPPLFHDVQTALATEIREYIDRLPLSPAQKGELLRYYDKVWIFVTSGEINLELDVHYQLPDTKSEVWT